MGGRAAEETVFNEVTTGAANDFDQATRIAKAMVVEFGMSQLGPVNFGPTMDVAEWGKSYYEQNSVSQDTLSKIDVEVKKLLETARKKAMQTLKEKRKLLDVIAQELLAKESLDGDEFEALVGKKENKPSL